MRRNKALVVAIAMAILIASSGSAFALTVTEFVYGKVAEERFADIPAAHWAADAVGRAVQAGIVRGYPDGTFRPQQEVSNAEFTTMLIRLVGLEAAVDPGAEVTAADAALVPGWARGYLALGMRAGIVSLDEEGRINAEKPLQRWQAAVMIARALKLRPTPPGPDDFVFADWLDIPPNARLYLITLYKKGIFKGYPDGTFGPFDKLNRAQAATLISRLIEIFK